MTKRMAKWLEVEHLKTVPYKQRIAELETQVLYEQERNRENVMGADMHVKDLEVEIGELKDRIAELESLNENLEVENGVLKGTVAEWEDRCHELEAALTNILGWRERDYTNMADTLHYIEEIATNALEVNHD